MSGCCDGSVNPYAFNSISLEIGREAWRSTRALDATGPTGVVQNMAAPTGPYSAIVDGSFCGSSLPSLSVSTVFGFNAFNSNWQQWDYQDGIVEISTLATYDLTRRAWIKAEIVPFVDYATYPGQEKTARFGPLTIARNYTQSDGPPSVEPVGNLLSQRTMLTPWDYGDVQLVRSRGFYLSGPVRIRAGYNNTTTHDFYDVWSAVAFPSSNEIVPTSGRAVHLKIGAFECGIGEAQNLLTVAAMAFIEGAPFVFPISIPRTALFNEDESVSDVSRYNGIRVEFDKTRMSSQPIADNKIVPPPITSANSQPIIGADRTDVIVPAAATGSTTPKPLTSAVVHLNPQVLRQPSYASGSQSIEYDTAFTYVFSNAAEHMRPDKHDRASARMLTGPTWHERNIVRYGSSLGQPNALHKFNLTCDWKAPDPSTYISCNLDTYDGWLYQWSFSCNPPFKIIADADLEFLPTIDGRRLLPGQYATAPLQMPSISINSVAARLGRQTSRNPQPEPRDIAVTVPVAITITPIVHAWAFSSVRATEGGSTQGPFGQPGVDGMTLDSHTRWTLAPGFRLPLSIANGRLDILFEVWAKVSVTSIDVSAFRGTSVLSASSFASEKTQYLKIRPPGNSDNLPFYSPVTTFALSDSQCNDLSNGSALTNLRRSPQAGTGLFQTDPSDVSYSLQFSIP